jgi:hypothetical protein
MNYDPVSREVIGSVDHSMDDVTTIGPLGCCGDLETHRVVHAADCHCFGNEHRHVPWPTVATVPDVEGRDVLAPHELAQVRDYAHPPRVVHTRDYPVPGSYDGPDDPPSVDDLSQRVAERTMWALESIARSAEALVKLFAATDG